MLDEQRGISFVLIDMKSPGIEVWLMIMLDGGHEVNEVFLDNVEVPVENLRNWNWLSTLATAAACAEGVGAMAMMLKLTADLNTRKQFGVPIASFRRCITSRSVGACGASIKMRRRVNQGEKDGAGGRLADAPPGGNQAAIDFLGM